MLVLKTLAQMAIQRASEELLRVEEGACDRPQSQILQADASRSTSPLQRFSWFKSIGMARDLTTVRTCFT
jgi:hypothetical protein